MRWLLFLSRLAFLCGIFFLMSLSLLFWNWAENSPAVSTVIVIGYLLGMVIVPLTVFLYFLLALSRKKFIPPVPGWLAWVNFLFLLIFIIYIIFQNVQNYSAP